MHLLINLSEKVVAGKIFMKRRANQIVLRLFIVLQKFQPLDLMLVGCSFFGYISQ